ncbi:MAG: hypothetical protein ACR2L3_04935 [Actinomycetota bacterium]
MALVVFLTVPLSSPAFGWSNGSEGYNSFGAHDWILAKALQGAGSPGWVNKTIALRATDDPDSKDGISYASGTWWHVWDRWGATYGGAPEAAGYWFRVVKQRRADGNKKGASRALGMLAHIVGDIGNPTHTDSTDREDRMHSAHESATDGRLGSFRFSFDGERTRRPVSAVKALANRSHKDYYGLVKEYTRYGYNSRVQGITQRSLNRASNYLADLILSL